MLQATAVARLILFAAIAWVTLRHYRQTRNFGFLIIGCGVLVWPLIGPFLVSLVAYFMLGRNLWLELLVDRTGQVIGAGLILAGLIAIQRSINSVGRGVHHGV
jgi:hypothetical protein